MQYLLCLLCRSAGRRYAWGEEPGWTRRGTRLPVAGEPLPGVRGTRGVALRLLRGGELTADELGARLGVTPNAARFHLAELERTGLVAQRAVRGLASPPAGTR